jgi:carbon storage regulator
MLVLTRRPGESIIIGDGIKLTVVNVGPGRVKIGIVAPPNVRIDREEIHARIQQEQAADVLAAVSSDAMGNDGEQNTMINSGLETGIFHNRIVDKLPSETPAPTSSSPTPTAKPSRYRPLRKPR